MPIVSLQYIHTRSHWFAMFPLSSVSFDLPCTSAHWTTKHIYYFIFHEPNQYTKSMCSYSTRHLPCSLCEGWFRDRPQMSRVTFEFVITKQISWDEVLVTRCKFCVSSIFTSPVILDKLPTFLLLSFLLIALTPFGKLTLDFLLHAVLCSIDKNYRGDYLNFQYNAIVKGLLSLQVHWFVVCNFPDRDFLWRSYRQVNKPVDFPSTGQDGSYVWQCWCFQRGV